MSVIYDIYIRPISVIPWPVIAKVYESLHWTILHQCHHNQMLCQVHRCLLQQAPVYIPDSKFIKNSHLYSSTQGANKLHLPILVQTSSDCHLSTRVPITTTSCCSIYNDLIIQLYNIELFTPTIILCCFVCLSVTCSQDPHENHSGGCSIPVVK